MLRNDLYRPWFVGEDWGFEFITGEYKDLAVQVEDIKFEESKLDLKYHIVNRPSLVTEEDVKSEAFESLIEILPVWYPAAQITRSALSTYFSWSSGDIA